MSDVIEAAVAALNNKVSGFAGNAKFVISGEGAVMIDGEGARAGDEDADVTMTADADIFQAIMEGDMDPTAAFMQGKLTVDGDMGQAMALAGAMA